MEIAFKGGTVVTHRGSTRADLLIRDGAVAGIGDIDTGQEIDAAGLLLLPGMVDTHVHLMDPGPTEREDFPTGTRAAAARGVTTIVEHTHAHPIRTAAELAEKRAHLEGRSNVDYGLAAHVWPDRIDDLAELWREGITFFKIFTCATHGVPGLDPATLHRALDAIGSFGGCCLIHCEDESITAEAERALRAAGRTDPGLLIEWRNREAELVAVGAAAVLARVTGARATIAHVSSPEVIDVIEAARGWGADLAAEACPQYFALEESEVLQQGALRKFTPPARLRSEDDRSLMWGAVRAGGFSHFSTDHAPSTREQKAAGDIWEAPFGLPGLDTTLPFLVDAALTGLIDLEDVARLYSHAPAVRYGLAPAKGDLQVGSDGDLVLVDPSGDWQVSDSDIISKAGWSPFTGRRFRGRIVAAYLRGQEIAAGGAGHGLRSGRYLPGAGRVA